MQTAYSLSARSIRARAIVTAPGSGPTCFFLMDLWQQLGGGMARVRVFDPRLSAGDYITKQLDRNPDASLARGFHESGKLNWSDCQLTIANSVLRAAKRQIEEPRTRR